VSKKSVSHIGGLGNDYGSVAQSIVPTSQALDNLQSVYTLI